MSRLDPAPETRVSFGAPEDHIDQLDEIAARQNKSRSQVLRELVADYIEVEDPDVPLPEDDQLADAYRALRTHANPEDGRIDTETAETVVSQAVRAPKKGDYIREHVFDPLSNRGYLEPRWGVLFVREPESPRRADV